jgi:Fungal domain of unknown function (DUF1746)
MNPASSRNADDPLPVATEETDTGAAVASSADESPSTQQQKRHVELLEDLLRTFDSLIFIELSVLFYLDCVFRLLIVRTLVQLFLLTARPPGLPPPPTRSALGAVVGSNILCILHHVLSARPEAGLGFSSYLHGSILIDFVGQLGPTPKTRLLCMDVLVLALQITMLGLGIEKRRMQNSGKQTLGVTQDLEAEEAGLMRSEDLTNDGGESSEGIEMQELFAEGSQEEEARQPGSNTHVLDELYTGHAVLARVNIAETIARDVTSPTASGSAGSTTTGGLVLPGLFGLRLRSLG